MKNRLGVLFVAVVVTVGIGAGLATIATAAPPPKAGKVDMSVLLTDSADPARTGRPFDYIVTATNLSSSVTATSVTVTVTVPSGATTEGVRTDQGTCSIGERITCTLGKVPPGTTASVTVSVQGSNPAFWTASATVAAEQNDPAQANNEESETTEVIDCTGCPTASIEALNDPVRVGELAAYDISADYVTGSALEQGTELVVPVPDSAEFVFAGASTECCLATPPVQCAYADRVVVCRGIVHPNARLVLRPLREGPLDVTVTARVRRHTGPGLTDSVRTTVLAPLAPAAATPAPVHDTAEATREQAERTVADTVDNVQTRVDDLRNDVGDRVRALPLVCGYARPVCDTV